MLGIDLAGNLPDNRQVVIHHLEIITAVPVVVPKFFLNMIHNKKLYQKIGYEDIEKIAIKGGNLEKFREQLDKEILNISCKANLREMLVRRLRGACMTNCRKVYLCLIGWKLLCKFFNKFILDKTLFPSFLVYPCSFELAIFKECFGKRRQKL